jgi:hypothetical protein
MLPMRTETGSGRATVGRMPAVAAPPPWISPVTPVVVERRFRMVARYGAGGHRGIDLAVEPGDRVRAPCGGRVTFRGRVAGGPQTVTLVCQDLRATLQRVAPAASVVSGASLRRGSTLGVALGTAVDLSARSADGEYLDPLPLLAAAQRHRVPPTGARRARRPSRPGPSHTRPAQLPEGALLLPTGVGAPAFSAEARSGHRARAGQAGARPHGPRAGTEAAVDWPLAIGGGIAALAGSLTGLLAVRRSPRTGRRDGRLPNRALVARDRR